MFIWCITLTKNADIDKYGYSAYGIGFDSGSFSFPGGGFGQNLLILGLTWVSLHTLMIRKKTY